MQSSNSNGSVATTCSRFRIVCHQADGSVGLLTFCQTLSQARLLAKREADQHLARLRSERLTMLLDAKRPAKISVEQWVGETTSGHWKAVDPREGGYEFTFYDSPPRRFRSKKPFGSSAASREIDDAMRAERLAEQPSTPRCGDVVECVLLARRTRKNGWLAKVATRDISGPVTGPPPAGRSLEYGTRILLKVCSCKPSTGIAQFAWI